MKKIKETKLEDLKTVNVDLTIKTKEGEFRLENVTTPEYINHALEFAVTFRFKDTFKVSKQSIKSLTSENLNKMIKDNCMGLMEEFNKW